MPRFDQSFTGLCEQNLQDTLQLKQRYLDTKNKRVPKSKDKKQQDTTPLQSSVHVQQKFLKRPCEDHDSGGPGEGFEPPVKLQCTPQSEGLTKFSVEIVQQLEFTTSAANSQAQQISTNVTVKALTNASVKSDVSSPKSSNPSTPVSGLRPNSTVDIGTLVECVKQEPDNDFADLDQCAAALEKDAAVNGAAGFGGFSDLIGEDTNDEIITSDAFKDLISDISNYPEFMKDFDFDENKCDTLLVNGLKVEDSKELMQNTLENSRHSSTMHNSYSPPVFEGKNRISYPSMDFGKSELSPAAQTLKQMAEQHHKNQMGLSFNPNARAPPNPRSPYTDYQFQGEYGSPTSNSSFKNSPGFTQPDLINIKQEMLYQGNEFDMKRKSAGIYKQQYSPYSSPSASNHGSPSYLPRGSGSGSATPGSGAYGGGTPPRPSSGQGGNGSTGPTLQINQAQQLHISQHGQGHSIQVSAGQHLQLSGEIKGNVSIAAQQGMYFSQQQGATNQNMGPNVHSPQSSQAPGQNAQNPQHQQSAQQNQSAHVASGNAPSAQTSNQHSQGPFANMSASDIHGAGIPGNNGMSGVLGSNMSGNGGIPGSSGHNVGVSSTHGGMGSDIYSISQSQTINFTQQTLRQRASGANGIPTSMGPNGSLGPNVTIVPGGSMNSGGPMGSAGSMGSVATRHMSPQTLEQQKIIQQQMMRAQQVMMQQQHIVRPPPPEYKPNASIMQSMQPRYPAAPTTRRMPQPMPPSGPMLRSHNMYIMQQQQQQQQQTQHMVARNMYPRQQGQMGMTEVMPQHAGNPEWRQLVMSQQQNANFNPQMRSNFQQQTGGFNMNTGTIPISNLQHQQMRTQHAMVTGGLGAQGLQGMGQPQGMGQGPLQINNLNQQMLSHMQQQVLMQQQQNSNQMSMANMNLQQSQSLSINNQSLQHQLNNHQSLMNSGSPNHQSNVLGNYNSQATDFNLDFLENLPTADTSSFTEQELLNSFDSDPGFNLQDIL